MKNNISDKIKNIDISGIRKIFELAEKVENPIRLDIGLPDFPVYEKILLSAKKAMDSGKNQYTPTLGIPELRKKIIEKVNTSAGTNYVMENVIVTSAGSGALSIALTTLLNPGDEAIFFDPAFVIYEPLILQNSAIPISVNTDNNFNPDISDLKNKISQKTKVIIINTPNNPTGKVYRKEVLKEILNIAKKHDISVISDEVYKDFVYNDSIHISPASLDENVIVADSFSKSYALTGWRVGYLLAPAYFIQQVAKAEQFNFVCPPTPFQYACVEALEISTKEQAASYEKRANYFYQELKDFYDMQKAEGAFYFYISYPYDGEKFISDCLENSLLVVPGSAFSEKNTHFRVSFATNKDELLKAIKILKKLSK